MNFIKKITSVTIAALMLIVINAVVITASAATEARVTAYHKFDLDHDGVVDIFDLGLLKKECLDNPDDPRLKELSDFIHNKNADTSEQDDVPHLAPPLACWDLEEETYSEELTRELSQYLKIANYRDITGKDDIATIYFSTPEFDGIIKAKIGIPDEAKHLINIYTEVNSYALVSDLEHYYVELLETTTDTDKPQLGTALAFWDLTDETYNRNVANNLIGYLTNSTITNVVISNQEASIMFANHRFEGVIKAITCVPSDVYNLINIYKEPDKFSLVTDGINYYIVII